MPNINIDITPLLQMVPGAVAIGSSVLGKVVIDGKGNDQETIRLDGLDATPAVELPSGDTVNVVESFQKQSVALNHRGS